jgi:DNA-binding NarL/FixJ family response regulator
LPDARTEPGSARIRVIVSDTRRLVRDGVRDVLAQQADLSVVAVSDLSRLDEVGLPAVTTVVVLGEHDPTKTRPDMTTVRLADVVGVPDLLAAIRGTVHSPSLERPDQTASGSGARERNPLTARERSVLRAVSGGGSASQIAKELGISPRTVERHKQSVTAKLGVPNQARAVSKSMELSLLDDAV